MHIAFICLPAAGHVNPTLPVVSELVRRGHRVTYATAEKYAKSVESAGAAFFRSGEDLAAHFPRRAASAEGGPVPPQTPGMFGGMMSGLMERMLGGKGGIPRAARPLGRGPAGRGVLRRHDPVGENGCREASFA